MEPVHFHKSSLKTHKYTLYLLVPAIAFFLVVLSYLIKVNHSQPTQIATTNEPTVLGEQEILDNR